MAMPRETDRAPPNALTPDRIEIYGSEKHTLPGTIRFEDPMDYPVWRRSPPLT